MSAVTTDNKEFDQAVEQAQELFEKLRLNDPAVRRYYERLEILSREQEPSAFWLRTNIHSIAPSNECR